MKSYYGLRLCKACCATFGAWIYESEVLEADCKRCGKKNCTTYIAHEKQVTK